MADNFDRDAVLAQVERRRRLNAARIAELGADTSPEAVAAQLREAERKRRQRRAERAGQLDLGGQ
ncbi:hypothetical protein GCM10010399_44220 [Dactylosporangium fulvum]|uniref:Uncharacterized protein n=1 Tax=Dactylosporangium fulvum TaxID=53359 RepID=A0ABY5W958_9ACTN|nr:hypothetical protein [Dactylosporangium fulvum]UWP85910.1 hypothetical protein Dfulv_17325 [Dactylosporangium fulvum]